MFNVLSALGGGGQVNPTTSNNSSTILYALFAVFSGPIVNVLGPRRWGHRLLSVLRFLWVLQPYHQQRIRLLWRCSVWYLHYIAMEC